MIPKSVVGIIEESTFQKEKAYDAKKVCKSSTAMSARSVMVSWRAGWMRRAVVNLPAPLSMDACSQARDRRTIILSYEKK